MLIALLTFLISSIPLTTHAASSDPVGALRLKLRGNSDTIVSLPLHRPALLTAALSARSDNQLTLDATIPTLPAGGAYLLILSGAIEGAVLPITSASGATTTIDAADHSLSLLSLNDAVAVIPYWTLDTAFPAGRGLHATTDILSVKTQILTFSETSVGTNLSSSATYFYFAGDEAFAAGWYRFGDFSSTRGTTRIPPYRYIIVRHPAGAADTELLVTGNVQLAVSETPVATRAVNRAQDNLIASPLPVPVSLATSNLIASGAFSPTTDIVSVKDQLLVFNNSSVGKNKSSSATYFYFAGDEFFSAGWYRFGNMSQTVGNVALKPGEGFIIRKSASTTAETRFWTLLSSYFQ